MSNTLTQFAVLLSAIYGGVLMGALYDCCSMLRLLKQSKVLDAILDAVFWAGAFAIAAYTLLNANGYQVRLFAIAGFAAGFAAYHFTLSKLVMAVYRLLVKALGAFGEWLADMLAEPPENTQSKH